jgi:hypothetical protein
MTYEEIIDPTFKTKTIKATDKDGKEYWIPADPANSDYQRYLNPEAEQSTPSVTNGD